MTTLSRRDALRTIAAAAALPVSARAVPAAAAPSATDPADLSVTQALDELASRRLSPTELLDACLHRIERVEPTLRAFVTRTTGHARDAARASDARYANGTARVLDGIPVGIKDIYETAGVRTTAGSDALADWVPDEDATVVAHLHDAGAVMVGKTVTHEFAFGASSPPTRNPWDPRRHPGGSSGGSAALVGARALPMATGSDTLGSLRIPAAACGIVGVRPTFGLTSRHAVVPLAWTFDQTGIMARTVADAALLLGFVQGPDVLDPTTSGAGRATYAATANERLDGVRLGMPTSYFFDDVDPGVARTIDAAVALAEELGAQIVDVDLPPVFDEVMAPALDAEGVPDQDALARALGGALSMPVLVAYTEAAAYHYGLRRERGDGYSSDIALVLSLCEQVPATAYLRAQQLRSVFVADMQRLFDDHGLAALLAPTLRSAPGMQREKGGVNGSGLLNGADAAHTNTPWVFCGFPSMSLPVGLDDLGMPVGLQLNGPPRGEATLLGVAATLEGHLEFARHTPAVLAGGGG